MQFVHVEVVDALLGADQQMLVPRLRMNPRGGAVDAQWATVEDLGEAGAHVHLGCGRQSVGDGSRWRVTAFVGALRWYRWGVVQQIRLRLLLRCFL